MKWQDNPDIRNLPKPEGERVETGVTRFGDDWPGVFIRGDNAFYYTYCLKEYIQGASVTAGLVLMEAQLDGLMKLLESCNVMNLEGAAKDAGVGE